MMTFIFADQFVIWAGLSKNISLCSTWQQLEWHEAWGLESSAGCSFICLVVGAGCGLGPDGTTVCACLASSQYGGWPLRRSIPRRGLSRFYDMSQKSHSISFPVVTGLSRLTKREHRPYLLVDKWQYHIVRTHGMEYIGATIFGK